jgi:hypothetical protein
MPKISLTDDQRARLEEVRCDVEAAFVDTYGHARMEDAVEYLLDTYTPPDGPEDDAAAVAFDRIATAEYPTLQRVASNVPGVPGSGIDADEMRGKLLSELGPEKFAAKLSDDDREDSEDSADATDDSDDAAESASDGSADDDSGDAPADASGVGGLLSTANQLLDEHDDKWREGEGDTPYEVDLPDGSTESARTKDDVRQLLFRHY